MNCDDLFSQRKRISLYLETNSYKVDFISEEMVAKFYGGRGLNSSFLNDQICTGMSPWSKANPVCISIGLLAGNHVPGGCIAFASTLSPLTNMMGDAKITGKFASALLSIGFAQIVIQGQSEKPTCILINKNGANFLSADKLWGRSTYAAINSLKKQYPKSSILCIGPGGELLIPFASIMTDDFRSFARCGIGSIFGKKNIKAVIIDSSKDFVPLCDSVRWKDFKKTAKQVLSKIKNSIHNKDSPYYEFYGRGGTGGFLGAFYEKGTIPIKNWTSNEILGVEKLCSKQFVKYSSYRSGCLICPLHCFHNINFQHLGKEIRGEGIHIEFLACMGLMLGITDLGWILRLCYVANQIGIDIVEASSAIALAIECYILGIMPIEYSKTKLSWGNPEIVEKLLYKIRDREGLGVILALGTTNAATEIGNCALDLIVSTRGMAWNAIDARALKSAAVFNLTSTRGGDCTRGSGQLTFGCNQADEFFGKGKLVYNQENEIAILDSLGICKNVFRQHQDCLNSDDLVTLTNLLTDSTKEWQDFLEIGSSIVSLEQKINSMHLDVNNIELPSKMTTPIENGPFAGQYINYHELKRELKTYYNLRVSKSGLNK